MSTTNTLKTLLASLTTPRESSEAPQDLIQIDEDTYVSPEMAAASNELHLHLIRLMTPLLDAQAEEFIATAKRDGVDAEPINEHVKNRELIAAGIDSLIALGCATIGVERTGIVLSRHLHDLAQVRVMQGIESHLAMLPDLPVH